MKWKFLTWLGLQVVAFIAPLATLAADDAKNKAILSNPIRAATVTQVLVNLIQWLLGISAIIAMLALIAGAMRFILAMGKEQEIVKAKSIMLWAIAGFVLIILAFVIVNVVPRVLGGLA